MVKVSNVGILSEDLLWYQSQMWVQKSCVIFQTFFIPLKDIPCSIEMLIFKSKVQEGDVGKYFK